MVALPLLPRIRAAAGRGQNPPRTAPKLVRCRPQRAHTPRYKRRVQPVARAQAAFALPCAAAAAAAPEERWASATRGRLWVPGNSAAAAAAKSGQKSATTQAGRTETRGQDPAGTPAGNRVQGAGSRGRGEYSDRTRSPTDTAARIPADR